MGQSVKFKGACRAAETNLPAGSSMATLGAGRRGGSRGRAVRLATRASSRPHPDATSLTPLQLDPVGTSTKNFLLVRYGPLLPLTLSVT